MPGQTQAKHRGSDRRRGMARCLGASDHKCKCVDSERSYARTMREIIDTAAENRTAALYSRLRASRVGVAARRAFRDSTRKTLQSEALEVRSGSRRVPGNPGAALAGLSAIDTLGVQYRRVNTV